MARPKEYKVDLSLSTCDIQPFGEYTKYHEEGISHFDSTGSSFWLVVMESIQTNHLDSKEHTFLFI